MIKENYAIGVKKTFKKNKLVYVYQSRVIGKVYIPHSIPIYLIPYLKPNKERSDQIMNPFSVDDKVYAKEKDRRNGKVLYVICAECDKCKERSYALCSGAIKNKLLVQFHNGNGFKRYKYDYSELELEPPLPLQKSKKTYDLSPKEIRPLGTILADIPLIVPDYDEESKPNLEIKTETETETEKEEELEDGSIDVEIEMEEQNIEKQIPTITASMPKKETKVISGMFFDQFLTLSSEMTSPI